MFEQIIQQLFTNWHPMRWVALAFGLFLGYNWLFNSATVSGILSLFFLFQAVTNTGCLAGRCHVPSAPADELNTTEVQYEEIQNQKEL